MHGLAVSLSGCLPKDNLPCNMQLHQRSGELGLVTFYFYIVLEEEYPWNNANICDHCSKCVQLKALHPFIPHAISFLVQKFKKLIFLNLYIYNFQKSKSEIYLVCCYTIFNKILTIIFAQNEMSSLCFHDYKFFPLSSCLNTFPI